MNREIITNEEELTKTYDPVNFESKIYKKWLEAGVFDPNEKFFKKFIMVAPPPNVTGILHMGHGLNFSLQDILVRYKRMNQNNTLWVFGTDHAGIATQAVFEKQLMKKGKKKDDFTREEFVTELFKFKEKHRRIIVNQIEKLGSSYDHSRECFTLDEGMTKAVTKAFVHLYNKGLIYKGEYLINWDPGSKTAISDEEVEYKEVNGQLYYVKYFLNDKDFIEIATTRPETMFGDTAVAVNPEDVRYKHLIGSEVIVPIIKRKVRIIADSYVKMEFGSGAVKITPAHDPNDFELSKKYMLERINILNENAKLNSQVPLLYQGLSIEEARKKVENTLRKNNLLIKVEPYKHQVGYCYRSGKVVEPYLSQQWFVKMKPLAEKALQALKNEEIRFYPKRWENTYKHWLINIKDWCISRQLLWGHRIPAWYDVVSGELVVKEYDPNEDPNYEGRSFKRDTDVLDTWFSSWLWPFSSLGWFEDSKDFKNYYPTSTLVTAYDIIFFWVARMVMAGLEFTGTVPFRDIYITPLIRDKQGFKMSKSLGNGIDPIDVINEYGSDSLRFTLSFLSVQGQDVNIDTKNFVFGAKFVNKVWNASRFILSNLKGKEVVENFKLNEVDKWLLTSFNLKLQEIHLAFKNYKYNDATKAVYEFFWNDFCSWYIEISKIYLLTHELSVENEVISKLIFFLKKALIILHPFIPFISEEIFSKLPNVKEEILALKTYPVCLDENDFQEEWKSFNMLKEFISSIRTLRSEFDISPNVQIAVALKFDSNFRYLEYFKQYEFIVKKFVNSENIYYNTNFNDMIGVVVLGFESYADIKGCINKNKELLRLERQLVKYTNLIDITQKKLKDTNFIAKAPSNIIESEKAKLLEFNWTLDKLKKYVSNLK